MPFYFLDKKEIMNKSLSVLGIVLLSGCQQLMHGAIQPVITKDIRNGIYFTTCAGTVEDWASCYDKASATCNRNYSVLNKGDNSLGTQRDITFQCNK